MVREPVGKVARLYDGQGPNGEVMVGHPMFAYDEKATEAIFAYCRERLALDPVPLDYGGLFDIPADEVTGLITQEGRPVEEVLALFERDLAPAVVSIDAPTFLAFIPNSPTKNSLLFDMVVACSGLNGTSWLEAAGVVTAENQALDFLSQRAGLPEGAGGAFVSGGSMGNLASLTVARDVGRARRPEIEPHRVRIAISADAHASVGKALHVIGIEPFEVATSDHRFTVEALRAALAADPHPESVIAIVATAGTTNAGIVDDLEGLGTYAREHDLWFHVDGAYGGAAMLAPSHREIFAGLRHADSFVVDPHKWLFAPLDCAALIYRNPTIARTVLAQQAGYLDILHVSDDADYDWNPSDFAIHLSRRARGLPFWFSLVTYGVGAYESAIERGIELARITEEMVRARPDLEMVRPASLSIALFRRPGWSEARYNEWSLQLLRDQVAFVTPTKWEGETIGRFAFLHPDTNESTIAQVLDSMRD